MALQPLPPTSRGDTESRRIIGALNCHVLVLVRYIYHSWEFPRQSSPNGKVVPDVGLTYVSTLVVMAGIGPMAYMSLSKHGRCRGLPSRSTPLLHSSLEQSFLTVFVSPSNGSTPPFH
ncbi:hypothetical protein M378DRAFT_260003 [Amanita muscaria Koide BX008]|uniref:Uncharacterized protein n=1 Tax=Amanita muscaria (strain Koide BX008) TaxID=946122 RepID=A0A0C2TKL0_AMAMK|nr:hypothetical protein M378DRAFT_260003 [Amanita muscaria Koide BX008]